MIDDVVIGLETCGWRASWHAASAVSVSIGVSAPEEPGKSRNVRKGRQSVPWLREPNFCFEPEADKWLCDRDRTQLPSFGSIAGDPKPGHPLGVPEPDNRQRLKIWDGRFGQERADMAPTATP